MRFLSDCIRWLFYFPFRKCVAWFPHSWILVLGHMGGTIGYIFRRRRRKIMTDELKKLFLESKDPKNINTIVKNGFKISFVALLESFCFPQISRDNIDRWITLNGQGNLDQALSEKKGVIVVLIHFGTNQMIMPALGYRNYIINQLGSRPDDWNRLSGIRISNIQKNIFRMRLNLEHYLPANFIYIDKTMRPIYQCLQSNEIMLMAADGRAGTQFIKTTILNREINLSAGVFRIAKKTQAAIVPVFPVCNDKGYQTLYIQKKLDIDQNLPGEEWLNQAVKLYGKRMEKMVATHPDHYCSLMAEAKIRAKLDLVPLFEDNRS